MTELHPLAGLIEDQFLMLYGNDPLFTMYLEATTDEDSIEGSLFADECMAAKYLRDMSPADSPLRDMKLAYLRALLLAAMCRYQVPRTINLQYPINTLRCVEAAVEMLKEEFPALLRDFTDSGLRKIAEVVLEVAE